MKNVSYLKLNILMTLLACSQFVALLSTFSLLTNKQELEQTNHGNLLALRSLPFWLLFIVN